MAVVSELIRAEENGSISFGDYSLGEKTKRSDFELAGNSYKVKTYREITRLERNETVLYESVPGTAVECLTVDETGVCFYVSGEGDAQITLGMEEDALYRVRIDDKDAGAIRSSMSGKLSIGVTLSESERVLIEVKKEQEA